MPDIDDMFRGVRDALTVQRVFGEPIEMGEVTLLPAAVVRGGGGGGGDDDDGGGGSMLPAGGNGSATVRASAALRERPFFSSAARPNVSGTLKALPITFTPVTFHTATLPFTQAASGASFDATTGPSSVEAITSPRSSSRTVRCPTPAASGFAASSAAKHGFNAGTPFFNVFCTAATSTAPFTAGTPATTSGAGLPVAPAHAALPPALPTAASSAAAAACAAPARRALTRFGSIPSTCIDARA